MKSKKFLLLALCALMVPALSSCEDDDNKKPAASVAGLLPATDFTQSLSDIKQAEAQRGLTTTENGNTLTATKTDGGSTVTFTYNFNPDTQAYEYAKGVYSSDNDLQAITKSLGEGGFTAGTSAYGISVYSNATTQVQYLIDSASKTYYVLPITDDVTAWGRIDQLDETGKAGLIVPYLGKSATVELVAIYEKYHGGRLNLADSKVASGVYVYDVASNDKGYTQVKYWFDVDTKSKLEEAAVYFDANKRPTTEAVATYMNYIGLKYTSMTDPTDGSSVYFNYTRKFTAYLLMDKPEDESKPFTPNIHFTFTDLSDQLPPETVNLPEPIVDFGTMTLDEAVEQYKQKPYYTGTADDGFGGLLGIKVTTSSRDFPEILLMDEEGKYYAAMLLPANSLTLRSPYIKEWLEANNYEYKPKASILPTYVTKDKTVMAQFDITGEFSGFPSLSFQPNEYTGD